MDQIARPSSGFANFIDALQGPGIASSVVARQFDMAQDRGYDVIEIVRDPASKSPDRFHFLRFAQLRLQTGHFGIGLFALRDVLHRNDHPRRFSIRARERGLDDS